MQSKHPIDIYVEAQSNFREGQEDKASQNLAQALGSNKVTQPIKSAIGKLLDEKTYAHEVVLGILEAEIRRARNDRK